MKQTFLLLYFFFTLINYSQEKYPVDYFRNPLDIDPVIAGTFGELRSNHFHSGIDIKTQGKQGLKIYAAADGYVSRIKVAQYGFGKAIYINHPTLKVIPIQSQKDQVIYITLMQELELT